MFPRASWVGTASTMTCRFELRAEMPSLTNGASVAITDLKYERSATL